MMPSGHYLPTPFDDESYLMSLSSPSGISSDHAEKEFTIVTSEKKHRAEFAPFAIARVCIQCVVYTEGEGQGQGRFCLVPDVRDVSGPMRVEPILVEVEDKAKGAFLSVWRRGGSGRGDENATDVVMVERYVYFPFWECCSD